MGADVVDISALASELRLVLGRLVRRMRAEHRFSLAHGVVLGRLDREGPMSTSDLAAWERVRPQSMAQTVTELESLGLISKRPDPNDGRRTLCELTRAGEKALAEDRRRREGWLIQAASESLSERERRVLAQAVELLGRLADFEQLS